MTDDIKPPEPPTEEAATPVVDDITKLEARIAALEAQLDGNDLGAEAQYRDLLVSEVQQRIYVRNWAVIIAIVAMVFMAGVLSHAAHHYFWGPIVLISPSVAIAMFVAPIISITTITIVLLFGAYRRFKDDDLDKVDVTSIAATAARSAIGR